MPHHERTIAALALPLAAGLAIAQDNPAPDRQQHTGQQQTEQQAEQQDARTFGIGDPVPELNADSELEWVQGDTHTQWKDGHIYVLDFWATWCGPCIRAMPHIIELQDKYEDDNVHVIGVHVWGQSSAPSVEQFLDSPPMGLDPDGFNYDFVRETGDWAATNYMDATGSTGIPTIMIVNRQGKLAWIGHPSEMDQPLEQIVAGEYDLNAAAEQDQQRRLEAQRQMRMQRVLASPDGMRIQSQLRRAYNENDYEQAFNLFGELIELDPELLSQFRVNQYDLAVTELNDEEKARATAQKFLDSPAGNRADALNAFAWSIAGPNSAVNRAGFDHNAIALTAAERAATITDRNDPDILDTLARAYYAGGNLNKALETQQEAVDKLTDAFPQQAREDFNDRLEQYREEADNAPS